MRKTYLDNLRGGIVLIVILYHVFYMYNSLGIIRNVDIPGIPQMDIFLYLVYPWFMVCLFVIAGISACYALEKTDDKAYLKSRVRRILIPSIAGIFLLGWVSGWITSQYTDMFMGNGSLIPGFVKYLIYCMCGIGPLWFMHELFLATLILLLLRKMDKKEKLKKLGSKVNLPILCLLFLLFWGSSQILNTPLIEVYRNGIYIAAFLLGYMVFSHENVQDLLRKYWYLFLTLGMVFMAVYLYIYRGKNYSLMANLQSLPTNLFAWFGTLAVFSMGLHFLHKETAFTRHMRVHSFPYYVLHLPLMTLLAYGIDKILHLRGIAMYLTLLLGMIILLPPFAWMIEHIPVINRLLLGKTPSKRR